MSFINELNTKKRELNDKKVIDSRHSDVITTTKDVKEAVLKAAESIIATNLQHRPKVTVENIPKDLATSKDIDALKEVLHKSSINTQVSSKMTTQGLTTSLTAILDQLKSVKPTDNSNIVKSVENLNKTLSGKDKVEVTNLKELEKNFKALEKAVKGLKLDVKVSPVVKVDKPDLSGITKLSTKLDTLNKSIQSIPQTDSSSIEKELQLANETLNEILIQPTTSGGSGSHTTPYKDSSGDTAFVTLQNNSVPTSPINTLVPESYDYLSLAQTATVDTWTYYTGGSGGTLVATVTITYTDSTKATIANVART